MSIWPKKLPGVLAGILVISVLPLSSMVFAQAPSPSGVPSSVLPSGGGQALLDPSDTVILLLDHQAGLFQTVKSVAELRTS
jgi:hypothetical protein